MFIVKKTISGNDYYYLNKSVREGDRVISKTVAYLGKDKDMAEIKAEEFKKKHGRYPSRDEMLKYWPELFKPKSS